MKGKILIGTSGWQYKHWKGLFYPANLAEKGWLSYYSKDFGSVEINNSFYRLPTLQTFTKWYEKTPEDFRFAVKMNSFVSRILKLKDDRKSSELFLKNASGLKEKLASVLVQLPPNFKFNKERLENYLNLVQKLTKTRFAFEFRHRSWFNSETYKLLKQHNSSLVISQSSRWPEVDKVTTDFVYLRFHGPGNVYGSNYPDEKLEEYSRKIVGWRNKGLDVFAYFNNDVSAFAIKNALFLKKLLNTP